MDHPGSSIFQGTDIQLNSSQNKEEEEDLEDQKRRNEELQNLLMAKLDDFNFDESTVNSSNNISLMSSEDIQKYRDAVEPNEQLKVLYEVRVREVNGLKEELNNFKKSKAKEIEDLKRRLIISEAEMQQLKISLNSSENLLVEKTSHIKELNAILDKRDQTIKNYEKTIENLQLEMAAYESTVNELQLKVAESGNPFCLGAKKFDTEEMQRAHEEQVKKLESLLCERTKLSTQLEKENHSLQTELQKLIRTDEENRLAINILTDNFDKAQNQCHELIDIVEKLGNETRHLQERLTSTVSKSPDTKRKSMSNPLEPQVEKLKKMLLDKSVHIETLSRKLENYENNIKELLEYRQIKSDIYNKKLQQCDNKEHTTCLLLMQNDIKNCQKLLDDKDQQIYSLSTHNKELLRKVEEVIAQYRTDLQNISHNYNMPQLEKMARDLQAAQEEIGDLKKKLKSSEEQRQKLENENKNCTEELEAQLQKLRNDHIEEKNNLENQLAAIQKDLDISTMEIANLKEYANTLVNENIKLKTTLKETLQLNENSLKETKQLKEPYEKDESYEVLKNGYLEAVKNLHTSQEKVKNLETKIDNLTGEIDCLKNERDTRENILDGLKNELKNSHDTTKNLKITLDKYVKDCDEKEDRLKKLQQEVTELKEDASTKTNLLRELQKKNEELIQTLEEARSNLGTAKDEVSRLEAQLKESAVKRNLENAFKESKDLVDNTVMGDGQDLEMLKIESQVREQIQKEYFKKLDEMDHKYKQAACAKKEDHKACLENVKKIEKKHRDQMTQVLVECGLTVNRSEQEKAEMIRALKNAQAQHEHFKTQALKVEESYNKMLRKVQNESERNVEEMKKRSDNLQKNCTEKGVAAKQLLERINRKIDGDAAEITAIEKMYNDKIKKYVKSCKK